jgi:hypothetical protein
MDLHAAVESIVSQLPQLTDRTRDTLYRGVDAVARAAARLAGEEPVTNRELGNAILEELRAHRPDECRPLDTEAIRPCPCFQWVAAEKFEGRNGFRGMMTRYLSAVLLGSGSAESAVLWTLDWQTEPFDLYWRAPLTAVWAGGRQVLVIQYQRRGSGLLLHFPTREDLQATGRIVL